MYFMIRSVLLHEHILTINYNYNNAFDDDESSVSKDQLGVQGLAASPHQLKTGFILLIYLGSQIWKFDLNVSFLTW